MWVSPCSSQVLTEQTYIFTNGLKGSSWSIVLYHYYTVKDGIIETEKSAQYWRPFISLASLASAALGVAFNKIWNSTLAISVASRRTAQHICLSSLTESCLHCCWLSTRQRSKFPHQTHPIKDIRKCLSAHESKVPWLCCYHCIVFIKAISILH